MLPNQPLFVCPMMLQEKKFFVFLSTIWYANFRIKGTLKPSQLTVISIRFSVSTPLSPNLRQMKIHCIVWARIPCRRACWVMAHKALRASAISTQATMPIKHGLPLIRLTTIHQLSLAIYLSKICPHVVWGGMRNLHTTTSCGSQHLNATRAAALTPLKPNTGTISHSLVPALTLFRSNYTCDTSISALISIFHFDHDQKSALLITVK